jgi:hypothetical protein
MVIRAESNSEPQEAAFHELQDAECWHFNHCGGCGSGLIITPIDRQRAMRLCLDCHLYFDLRNLLKLN